MALNTTTFPRRNVVGFGQVRELLEPLAGRSLSILEAGPGLAVRYLGRFHSLRPVERLVRRLPLPDTFYESYETDDLLQVFSGADIRLTLLDVHPRPLRVISAQSPASVRTIVADLGAPMPAALGQLKGSFDLVVALALIGRIATEQQRKLATETLASLVKPGGLIFANQGDFAAAGCVPSHGLRAIFRKVA